MLLLCLSGFRVSEQHPVSHPAEGREAGQQGGQSREERADCREEEEADKHSGGDREGEVMKELE